MSLLFWQISNRLICGRPQTHHYYANFICRHRTTSIVQIYFKIIHIHESSAYQKARLIAIEVFENAPSFLVCGALYGLFFWCNCMNRWLVLDTETKDLVTVHTDGNEQLSVMRFSPGQCSSECHYNYLNSKIINTRTFIEHQCTWHLHDTGLNILSFRWQFPCHWVTWQLHLHLCCSWKWQEIQSSGKMLSKLL